MHHFDNLLNSFVVFCLMNLQTNFSVISGGQSDVEVQLISKQYLDKGSSVTLHCKHNVAAEYLYKVSFVLFVSIKD